MPNQSNNVCLSILRKPLKAALASSLFIPKIKSNLHFLITVYFAGNITLVYVLEKKKVFLYFKKSPFLIII